MDRKTYEAKCRELNVFKEKTLDTTIQVLKLAAPAIANELIAMRESGPIPRPESDEPGMSLEEHYEVQLSVAKFREITRILMSVRDAGLRQSSQWTQGHGKAFQVFSDWERRLNLLEMPPTER